MKNKNVFLSFLPRYTSVMLLCLLIASPFYTFSQAMLGIDSVSIPGTVSMQNTVPVTVTVRNTGNAVFSGPIDIYYGIDSAYIPVLLGTIPTVSLTPNDTTSLTTTLLIDSSQFDVGSNIVVFWPTSLGITTSDQKWAIIYVAPYVAGVPSLDLDNDISIYPNPAYTTLKVEYIPTYNQLESVRIFDLLGNDMHPNPGISIPSSNNIDISSLPAGVYLLVFTDTDGRLHRTKFVKYSQ